MDSKVAIIAVAVVAIVAVGGVATFFVLNDEKSDVSYDGSAYNIISRVNSEGSGLFIKISVIDDGTSAAPKRNGVYFYDQSTKAVTSANASAWGGLVFSDPGVSSIQHIQIATIASNAGLKFAQYTDGMSKSDDTLYYYTGLANYGTITGAEAKIDGGIIWEPQYQRIIKESSATFVSLALTNDLFKEHTCCIVAANHDWLGSNSDTAVKFLAAYNQAVVFINGAKADTSGADYAWLVDFAVNNTAGGTLTAAEVEDALSNITYLSADDSEGSLDDLEDDIEELMKDLKDLGVITSTKFDVDDADDLADAFVDNTYIEKALTEDVSKDGTATVKVAVIDGDIHQLAIHVAKEKGYFSDYGLTVEISKGSNGGDIATMLLSKDVNIGFLGAPPATSNTINGDHILV